MPFLDLYDEPCAYNNLLPFGAMPLVDELLPAAPSGDLVRVEGDNEARIELANEPGLERGLRLFGLGIRLMVLEQRICCCSVCNH